MQVIVTVQIYHNNNDSANVYDDNHGNAFDNDKKNNKVFMLTNVEKANNKGNHNYNEQPI